MILTNKQTEGLTISIKRYFDKEPYTIISGYAGSGKSTLIKYIISALPVDPVTEVCYIAFTGKAATVLKQKGCYNATTAHKLLYYSKQLPSGKFIHEPRKNLEDAYKVIVVDEVSMLPKPMWDLLLSHKIYVLACGDPGQLPPVNPEDNNHVLDNPHIFLDEIMRQAQDSEIIRLSMHVREGKPLSSFQALGEQVKLFSKNEICTGMYDWADQILCATNDTRNYINNFIREKKGYGPEPCVGDKIISLSNHWEFYSANGNWPLTNGSIGTIDSFFKQNKYTFRYIRTAPIEYMMTHMDFEDDTFMNIPIDYNYLVNNTSTLTPIEIYKMKKNKNCDLEPPYDFAYAYAITCHKAQGSEWNKVLVFKKKFPFNKEEHQKWLYTAITRAKDKLVLIRSS